jgi:hypothetical protein
MWIMCCSGQVKLLLPKKYESVWQLQLQKIFSICISIGVNSQSITYIFKLARYLCSTHVDAGVRSRKYKCSVLCICKGMKGFVVVVVVVVVIVIVFVVGSRRQRRCCLCFHREAESSPVGVLLEKLAFPLGRSPRASQSAVCTATIDALPLTARGGGLVALPLPVPPLRGRWLVAADVGVPHEEHGVAQHGGGGRGHGRVLAEGHERRRSGGQPSSSRPNAAASRAALAPRPRSQ